MPAITEVSLAADWSRLEVEAIVSDYFAMLEAELRGESFNKAARRRSLMGSLNERSEQSVEFKHANISAVMISLGMPYIDGYKPRGNYQQLLADAVANRLAGQDTLVRAAEQDVDAPIAMPAVDDILSVLVDPPHPDHTALSEVRLEPSALRSPTPRINYLEREASNHQLGAIGESFVLAFERARLIKAGCERLAARIEHVAVTRGDAEGFDILSFESSGQERFIEVKTTRYGVQTPFFVSQNELAFSRREADRYHLYRAFGLKKAARLFQLPGALSKTCLLSPTNYIASVA